MGTSALKIRMRDCGLTMRWIERETGISYSTVNLLMNGYKGVSQKNKNTIEGFIANCETLLHESNNLETNEAKLTRLCNNMDIITNEIRKTVQSGELFAENETVTTAENANIEIIEGEVF